MTQPKEFELHNEDRAPGDERPEDDTILVGIRGYVIGLIFAASLTAISFLITTTHFIYAPGVPVALIVFAIAQMGVHLVFFLHINTGPDNTNNIMALAFGVLIVLIVIVGSIWIMYNLNENMTQGEMMQMMTSPM